LAGVWALLFRLPPIFILREHHKGVNVSDYILDLVIEAKRLDGVWVTCDNPELAWCGCRFLIKPATTKLAEKVQRIQKLSGDGRNIVKFTEALLKDLLIGVEGIGIGDREATVDEAVAHFCQIPALSRGSWSSPFLCPRASGRRSRPSWETDDPGSLGVLPGGPGLLQHVLHPALSGGQAGHPLRDTC
jgi:hypothetical protein